MKEDKQNTNSMLRYAGLATQWLIMLGLAVWAGWWLDGKIKVRALFIIVLPVAALCFSLWQLIQTFNKKDK